MEKRLEAFVRIAHCIIIFPGGVGTAEELLFLLGILMNPQNSDVSVPVILTGPKSSAEYFAEIDEFIDATLGSVARKYYRVEIGNPARVAGIAADAIRKVTEFRRKQRDAFYFNWRLKIESDFQAPFLATHDTMSALEIDKNQGAHVLASNLRRAFSGLVAGNVKDHGIRAIEAHGPFEIHGDGDLMSRLDCLLTAFANQGRMRLAGRKYVPCYRILA